MILSEMRAKWPEWGNIFCRKTQDALGPEYQAMATSSDRNRVHAVYEDTEIEALDALDRVLEALKAGGE